MNSPPWYFTNTLVDHKYFCSLTDHLDHFHLHLLLLQLHDDHHIIFVPSFLLLHRSLSVFQHLFPEKERIIDLIR